eukprot:m.59045 g.59045  ORF g.59045 m.59045 type:complete len:518 (-) comp13201_c1_seq1:229-1782(-)
MFAGLRSKGLSSSACSPSFDHLAHQSSPCLPSPQQRPCLPKNNNFLKGCKWSPDGLCIAACSDDNRIRLFNLPDEFLATSEGGGDNDHDQRRTEEMTEQYMYAASDFNAQRLSRQPAAESFTMSQTQMSSTLTIAPTTSTQQQQEQDDQVQLAQQYEHEQQDGYSVAFSQSYTSMRATTSSSQQAGFHRGQPSPSISSATSSWSPVLTLAEGELVYDYCWLPTMSSYDPSTCLLASSSRDHPTHVWDAFTGELRGTYRSYDQYDEIAAATALSFTPDGSRLYCGLKNAVHVFDTERPGRDYLTRDLTKHGLKGIVSSLAFPLEGNMYATGFYNGGVSVFDEHNGELSVHLKMESGVTHMLFSPHEPHLYVGLRKHPVIGVFDLRRADRPLLHLTRSVTTNQRIYFDLDATGQYLVSGDQRGGIVWWDMWSCLPNEDPQATVHDPTFVVNDTDLIPDLHTTAVNGVSLHPYLPLIATASGQRQFGYPDSASDTKHAAETRTPHSLNTLKLWQVLSNAT